MQANTIHCGNHLDILKAYPDGFFDRVLTSPPYDNLRDYEGYDFQFEPLAHELYRVLKDCGVCVWVVNDETKDGSESLTSFKQALYFKEVVGFNVHDTRERLTVARLLRNSEQCNKAFEDFRK
jgi:DNA modification methylase